MGQMRRLRRAGESIVLGGTKYRLEAVEGMGGSAVVYRARYEDRLNQGCFHQVLIKELFPFHARGLIYRDDDGCVRCVGEGEELMERSRQSFFAGNRINLELLSQQPEQISGNLNSFAAYGTCYSVLPVHGGRNLEELLEEGKAFAGLRAAAEGILKILDALECFHRNGFLHLDISPDNILMLPDRALLIDYNSVWPMERRVGENRCFSEKEGYSAPEVRLLEEAEVGTASDLYSVCAVFFRMLTGRRLSDEEVVGNGLTRSFPKDLEIFMGEPETAARKAVQITVKGLQVLVKKRWRTVSELRGEVEELIRRIAGRGVTHSALWEGSRRSSRLFRQPDGAYRAQGIRLETGAVLTPDTLYRSLREGRQVLLTGSGGMGKTRLMTELWRRGVQSYQPRLPVVLYLPLADYRQAGEEPSYIRRALLRKLCFENDGKGMEDALHELGLLMEPQDAGKVNFILLLDGLNEAGEKRRYLLREIEELGKKSGVGVLVTDRTDAVKKYGLYAFETAELLPFSREEVMGLLRQQGLQVPEDEGLRELLTNPMVFSLYCKTMRLEAGEARPGDAAPLAGSMEEMTERYLESLHTHQLRIYSGDRTQQLRCGYLLQHLLPAVAGELNRGKKTQLTFEELYALTEKSYRMMQQKCFSMAFPEYLGKSRQMLAGLADAGEWFNYAVTEQLEERLNLLEKSDEGNFRLLHDNFIFCLAVRDRENRRKIAGYRWKAYGLRGGFVTVAAALLLSAGIMVFRFHADRKPTAKQQQAVRGALERLAVNMTVLNNQIQGQKVILEKASSNAVLEGDQQARQELAALIEKRLADIRRQSVVANDGGRQMEKLEDVDSGLPLEALESLYQRHEEMGSILAAALEHLKSGLCREDSPYVGRARREPLVTAYQEYLEGYARVSYLEFLRVFRCLDAEDADMVMESVMDMAAFQEYILQYPLSGQTEEELARQQETAERRLALLQDEMRMQNYRIEGTDR